MVLDMATSLVSMGKIHDHADRGLPIPSGWALDCNGNPTTDAVAAKSGAIAPFGGAKGYALGVALEVLVASLTGSAIGTHVTGTLDSTTVSNKGDILIAIAPDETGGRGIATAYLDLLRDAAPGRPGVPVLTPGDRARQARAHALAHGIDIDPALWATITALARP